MRFQPRVKGGRDPLGSAVLHSIRRAVQGEAERFDCSRSFVVATILAAHFGLGDQANYKVGGPEPRRRKRKGKSGIQKWVG